MYVSRNSSGLACSDCVLMFSAFILDYMVHWHVKMSTVILPVAGAVYFFLDVLAINFCTYIS